MNQISFSIEQMCSNFPLGEQLAAEFGERYFLELGLRIYKATGEDRITFRSLSVANLIMKDLHTEWIINKKYPS